MSGTEPLGTRPSMVRRYSAAVIVASTSAAADPSLDLTGPLIRDWLVDRGFDTASPIIVPDGVRVSDAIQRELALRHRVILTTGGTGITPDDRTPEATAPLLDMQTPGIIEAARALGLRATPHAMLTRGVAGFSGPTFIMNLPGSTGGVRDGLAILDGVLAHLIEQREAGGGHPPRDSVR